jgi:hypothetical protein
MEGKHKIHFSKKTESNARRLQEALERTPDERFQFFLRMCEEMQLFENSQLHKKRANHNFIIE